MAATGRKGWRLGRELWVPILAIVLEAGVAAALPDAKATRPASAGLEQSLGALSEQQKEQAAAIATLRDQVAELKRSLAEVTEELKRKQEAQQATLDANLTQVKEMREEVRGLYVESSGIKGDVAQATGQIETLDQNLSSFRLSAGIVVAVVIVLQLVLVALALRQRG